MSLTTMTSGRCRRCRSTAMLFSASQAMPAGQRAVADDRDHVAVLAAQRVGLGQPVGVGERGGGVGVLDDVVLGLGLAGVAGQPALGAQRVEAVGAAGEHLVDVGLVAGVEDDPVGGRVEDPVQRDGQLDHAEVGAQVAAARRAGARPAGRASRRRARRARRRSARAGRAGPVSELELTHSTAPSREVSVWRAGDPASLRAESEVEAGDGGSSRLPSHTRPLVLAHAGDQVEVVGVAGRQSCTTRPSSSNAMHVHGALRLRLQPTRAARRRARRSERGTARQHRLQRRPASGHQGHPDQPVGAARDVVGVAGEVARRGGRTWPRRGPVQPPRVRRCGPRDSRDARRSDSSAASATPLAKRSPLDQHPWRPAAASRGEAEQPPEQVSSTMSARHRSSGWTRRGVGEVDRAVGGDRGVVADQHRLAVDLVEERLDLRPCRGRARAGHGGRRTTRSRPSGSSSMPSGRPPVSAHALHARRRRRETREDAAVLGAGVDVAVVGRRRRPRRP